MGLLSNYSRSVSGGAYVPRTGSAPPTLSRPWTAQQQTVQSYAVPGRIAPVSVLDEWTGHAAGFVGEAVQTPARILEAPVSLLNQGIKSLSSALFGGNGIDVAADIGAGHFGTGFRLAGQGVEMASNFVPALINSTDANWIYKYRNEDDDFEIPDFGETTEGPPILGMFGIGGRQKTLGELKMELRSRGFTDEDFLDIQQGRRSIFDFGDRMTNDNLLVGLATRMVMDPINLLFAIPGAGAAKIGAGLSSLGTRAGSAVRGLATTARRGDTAFDLAVKSGTRPSPIPSAANLAREMSHGRATGVLPGVRQYAEEQVRSFNQKGFDFRQLGTIPGVVNASLSAGKFVLDPRGYATRTGFFKRASTLYGAELAITALPDGILDGMQSFAQESLDRRPLSDNTAFMLAAAFTVPFREMVQMMPEYWNASMTKTFDNTVAPDIERIFGMSVDELGRSIGGRGNLEKMIFASAVNVLRNSGDDLATPLKAAIQSMQERGDTALSISRNVYVLTHSALTTGRISGRDIAEQMVADFKNASSLRGEKIELPNGTTIDMEDLVVQLPFDPHKWIERTSSYLKALKAVEDGTRGNPFGLRDRVTVGLRTSYTREQMDPLIVTAKGLAVDGQISLSDVRSFLTANQILFRMHNRENYAQFLGDYPREAVPVDEFVKLLEQTKAHPNTPTNSDYYWKDEEYQREAIFQQPDGPMQTKLETLSAKISATLDGNTGMVKRGQQKRYDFYRERLRREVAFRVSQGDAAGAASPKLVAQALRAEVLRIEAKIAQGADMSAVLDDLVAAEKFFGVRARGGSGARSQPEFVKALMDANDLIFPTPKLDDAIVKHIPEWYHQEMQQLTDEVWQLGKEYTVTLAPKDSYLPRPSDRLPEAMLKQRNLMARVMYDHNIFGAPARFMDFITRPVGSSKMLADAEQAVMNEYIGAGAKPDQVRTFLAKVRDEAIEKHSLNPKYGYRLYGSVKAVLPQTVNKIARDVFGGPENPVQVRIGPENHHRVIDRASSRLLRDLRERNAGRKRTGKLSSLVADRYWQDFERDLYVFRSGGVTKSGKEIRGLAPVLGGTRLLSNTLYHLFRFIMDPRWWLMNHFEHVVIGSVRDGMGSKTASLSPRFRRASGMNEGFKSDPADMIAGTMSANKPSYLVDAAETGMFHGNRAVAARIAKTFDKESPQSIEGVLNDMQYSDPALVKLRRDFGTGDNRQLAEILDEQWFNFDRKGVGRTVREEYIEIFRDEPKTAQSVAEQALIIQRVTELNRNLYDDLVKTYLGNPDRTTIERVMNSYWLFWPLSYQIKASKWLVRAMTMQAFGRDTNALGLYQYANLKEYFADQLVHNEQFAEQWDGQEHLWETAAMFFPITPEDIGVSLSRPVRTFGNMFFPDWFPPNFGSRDPIAALAYTFEIGPLYTVRLLRSLSATIYPEGADYSIIEPQIPDLDIAQFSTAFPVQVESIPSQ